MQSNQRDEVLLNPYAPPTSVVAETPRHSSYLWREGDWLVIRIGAELPPYCMVSGDRAPYSHPVSQIWQPKWVYFLLILAVVPYFVMSPFLYRRVELTVPFGKSIYRKHRRWVNLGIVLVLTGGLIIVSFFATLFSGLLSSPSLLILIILGVLMFCIGGQIASRSPVRLDIIKVEDDLIFVDKVHPDYLARLPNVLDPTTANSEIQRFGVTDM